MLLFRKNMTKVAMCGRTKYITYESLIVYEQLCRKRYRKRNIHNLLTPPGLFTFSLSFSVYRSLSLFLY